MYGFRGGLWYGSCAIEITQMSLPNEATSVSINLKRIYAWAIFKVLLL